MVISEVQSIRQKAQYRVASDILARAKAHDRKRRENRESDGRYAVQQGASVM